jgi:hypothetical protein
LYKHPSNDPQLELFLGDIYAYAANGQTWADLSESPTRSRSTSPNVETSGSAWNIVSISPSKSSQKYQLHQKLSSPSRKKLTPTDIKYKQEEKLAKAEWNRNSKQIQNQIKAQKEAEKIQQVTDRKAEQLAMKKEHAEEKLQRAQKNHSNILKKKSEDAKMENMKVDEIRFIQQMYSEDNKFQLDKKLAESKAKRDKMLIERKEKIKEESIREAAAKKKREEIEYQRLQALECQMKMKKEKEERMLEKKKKKSAERQSKNLQYETKVQKTKETKIIEIDKLKSEYEKKMEASAARKNLSLEMRREKAAAEVQKVKEAGTRKSVEKEESFESNIIIVENDEKMSKSIKKKAKKIRMRILGQKKKLDAQSSSSNHSSVLKPRTINIKRAVQDIQNQLEGENVKDIVSAMENLKKAVDIRISHDVKYLIQENVLACLVKFTEIDNRVKGMIDRKIDNLELCVEILVGFASVPELSCILIISLDILPIIDLLAAIIDSTERTMLINNLIRILTYCIQCNYTIKNKPIEDNIKEELTNYIITLGILDKLKYKYLHVQSTNNSYIVHYLQFLSVIVSHFTRPGKIHPIYQKKEISGSSLLVQKMKSTTMFAILPLLTSLLLGQGTGKTKQKIEIENDVLYITFYAFKILNYFAFLDLAYLQETLGDTFQSELFHIISHLLSFCTTEIGSMSDTNSHNIVNTENNAGNMSIVRLLLNELVLLLGFFTLNNEKNQEILQFNNGRSSTLLQRLCSLPIQYFTDPELKCILIPTLISICFNNEVNKDILQQEISTQLITNFMEQEKDKPSSLTLGGMYEFRFRFPPNKVKEAIDFLKK